MRLRHLSHLIPALPRRGGEGGPAGEAGVREEGAHGYGLDPSVSSADSSPYEGEPKRTRSGPEGREFLLRLRAGRGSGRVWNPPLRSNWEIFL